MTSAPLSVAETKLSAKELFNKYDEDKSGKISFPEFQKMLPDLGIHLSIPKQIEYFRLCDQDGSGQIDYEEFKVALFVCDTEEVNYAGFNAGTILRPKDAFEMFDKDDSGRIDEEEFYFLLQYLNVESDEDTHEKMFRKYDLDKSGFIEYPEFKKAWLRLANTKKELEDRGIDVPTLATKYQMINMLEKTLDEEERQEQLAIEETKRWRITQKRLKLKREYILKVKHQAKVELCNALDVGGSVYVFGNGTLDQFTRAPRTNMNTTLFHQEGCDLLVSLWNFRVGSRNRDTQSKSSVARKTQSIKEDLILNMKDEDGNGDMKGLVKFDESLNIQRNTVWLWGRQCRGVAISESVIIAFCQDGSLFSWGGSDQWWHQLEAESCWQNRTRGEMTARSCDLLGCAIDSRSESTLDCNQSSRYNPEKFISESDMLAKKIKTVLQYYNVWSIPDGLVDLLDHAKKCLRNSVERQRVAKSLQLRGKATENLSKVEMVKTLYEDIILEHKLLGEPAHLELRELEREVVELIQQRKLKLAKRRQYKFTEKWRPLREAQRLDAKTFSGDLNEEKRLGKGSPTDATHSALVKRLKEQDEIEVSSRGGEIVLSGITPRGPRPTTITPTSQWKMIDAGSNHAGIIDNKNQLLMWGLDAAGRLGLGLLREKIDESKTSQKFHPKAIDLPNVRQFSCGHSHTAAVNLDGDLFVWGSASSGKLGLGDVTSSQECFTSIPIQLKNISPKKIIVVSCGANHTACVENEGGLYVWGNGGGGRLGLGHKRDVSVPTLVKTIRERIVDVSCGNCQILAITAIDRSSETCNQSLVKTVAGGKLYVAGPEEVLGSSYSTFDIYTTFSMAIDGTQMINPPPIHQISAGFSHQAAVSIDGELFLWGDNTKGCCGQDYRKAHFLPVPTQVNLYKKPQDLAAGKPTLRSVPYGNQPFCDIDLEKVASIREIKLWNCLKAPDNPAIKKNTFTGRIFPCWLMIAHEPFPESVGEGQLEAALKFSIAKKRLEQNLHQSVWFPPRGTKGRYVRIQMEGLNLMEFEKLQVFGSYDADTLEKVVSSTCGKRVTAAIIGSTGNVEDITMSYKRAVMADPYHAKILRQLDIYKDIERHLRERDPGLFSPPISSVGCLLCHGRILCPICQLKNDFRDILSDYNKSFESTCSNRYYMKNIINAVIQAE